MDEHEFDDLYPHLRNHNPDWADGVFNYPESNELQAEGATVGVTDTWQSLFGIPYLFYSTAMFESYYRDKYDFKDIYWKQTELYEAEDLTQCSECSRIRLESNVDARHTCDDRTNCGEDSW